jgi:hypothetical protein
MTGLKSRFTNPNLLSRPRYHSDVFLFLFNLSFFLPCTEGSTHQSNRVDRATSWSGELQGPFSPGPETTFTTDRPSDLSARILDVWSGMVLFLYLCQPSNDLGSLHTCGCVVVGWMDGRMDVVEVTRHITPQPICSGGYQYIVMKWELLYEIRWSCRHGAAAGALVVCLSW